MTFSRRNRLTTKIQMKCHRCRKDCLPKDGAWHEGGEGQVFLCKCCERVPFKALSTFNRPVVGARPTVNLVG